MISTNWCVITGAPSSGKTSVVHALAARGYATAEEAARALIEERLAKGLTLADIRSSAHTQDLQRDILLRKIAEEDRLDPSKTVFMDRGMGDSIVYFRRAGLDPEEARKACQRRRYKAVFIFDRLPVIKDTVRNESEADAADIDRMLEEDYKSLGYTPVRVPVLSIEERADFILEALRRSEAAA